MEIDGSPATSILDGIPSELKALRQWVCYRIEERDGKPTKIPYRTDRVGRGNARSNDPSTWHTFDEVIEAAAKPKNRFDGIGFILSESDPYMFIDLDHVVANGEIEPWAHQLIERVGSYTELSQSGTGIHIIARAKKPGARCRTHERPQFEIYDHLRLVVFTGKLFPGPPPDIRDAQAAVDQIYFEVFGGDPRNAPRKETARNARPIDMSDSALMERALAAQNGDKLRRLWSGDTGGYNGDASAADMALCCILAYWTDKDPARMDRLYRQSGLVRSKWDEPRGSQTYGQMTVDAAIGMTRETYADHAASSARSGASRKRAAGTAGGRSGHRDGRNPGLEGMLLTATYEYVDESGKPLFTVLRYEDPKGIRKAILRQEPAAEYRDRNRRAGKKPMDDVPRALYRLPRVLRTVQKGLPVLIVSGEKAVHSLERIGLVATCSPGGTDRWLPEYNGALQGGNAVIIPANDDEGRLHAELVARNLSGTAGRIRVLQLPDLREHGDVTDWIAAGGTKDRLIEVAKACPDWSPSPEYDEALAELSKRGGSPLSGSDTLSPEDEARALDTIETAISAGTAAAIYGDECITSLAMLSEGKRADLIQKISVSVKAVCRRDIKKKVAAKLLELSQFSVIYTAPEGQSGQLLSPNIPIKESCEAALSNLVAHNDPMRLFRRGGRMSRIRPNDQGSMKIEELAKEGIAYELNSCIDFHYVNPYDGETKHVSAPKHIIDYLYAHPELPFPSIDGVTEIPVLRKDGTILDKPGYDEVTRMYYHPPDGIALPRIPENPTPEERKQAAELLREVFCDMPFTSETDRTHTIALLLSPVLRQITGTTPLAVINAHQPSNGKSLLADGISLVVTGRTANNVTAPIDPKEWESFLAALLFSGEPLVFFDNVKHYIESASLEKVLTSEEVTSRVLGKSTALTVANRITFALTGNNVQVGREIARRSYVIDLDAQMSNPEDRPVETYSHPDLKQWVRDNRSQIVWSLFVIIRAWFADGCPRYRLPQVGSFEKWCALVGNIVTHAGFGGFLGNRDRLRRDSDQESAQWEAFLERWIELYGESPRSVSAVALDLTYDDKLGGVMPEDLSYCVKGHETNNVKIGRVFKRRDGCRFGPQQMRLSQGPIIRGQRMWTVLHEMELSTFVAPAEGRKVDLADFVEPDEPTPTRKPVFGVDTFDLALMPDDWDEDDE